MAARPDTAFPANPIVRKPIAKPGIYLIRMLVFLILVGFLAFILFRQITPAFQANPGLNGLILGVLLIAVLLAFGQVIRLYREASYVNAVAAGRTGQAAAEPRRPAGAGDPGPARGRYARGRASLSRHHRRAPRRGARHPALHRRHPDPARPARHVLGPDRHALGSRLGHQVDARRRRGQRDVRRVEERTRRSLERHRAGVLRVAVRPGEFADHRLPRPPGRAGPCPLPQRTGGLAGLGRGSGRAGLGPGAPGARGCGGR